MPGGVAGHFVDDDDGQDTRPILLFDLNGTLTSHTFARRSAGRSLMRPGIPHLRRLQVGTLKAEISSKKAAFHSSFATTMLP